MIYIGNNEFRTAKSQIYLGNAGEDVMARNVSAGRLSFTTDIAAAVDGANAVFIAVGTPTRRGDGHADLTYVMAAAEDVAKALTGYAVIVTKSTVPVGTNRKVKQVVAEANPSAGFDVASNPEFLREGAAIEDFMKPDRVVVGIESERAAKVWLTSIARFTCAISQSWPRIWNPPK